MNLQLSTLQKYREIPLNHLNSYNYTYFHHHQHHDLAIDMAQENGNIGTLPDAALAVLNIFQKLGPDGSVASASALLHTKMTDVDTGKSAYTDAEGNIVPREQVEIHRMAYEALRLIPEVTAEQLTAEWEEEDKKNAPADGTNTPADGINIPDGGSDISMDISDGPSPPLDTEMPNAPPPRSEADDTNPLPDGAGDRPDDGAADLDEEVGNPEGSLGGLDGSSDGPAQDKPAILPPAKKKPIVLIDPSKNKSFDLTGEDDENPQDVDPTTKKTKNDVQNAINSFRNVVKTPSKNAKKSSKSSKKKKKSDKKAQKVVPTPKNLKRKRVEESDKEESAAEEDIGHVGNKQPLATSPGPRNKRWSETKAWRKLLKAEEDGECPTDIDDLVKAAKKEVGRDLQKGYVEKIMKLKAIGFHDKCAQLVAEQQANETLEEQLNDALVKLTKANKTIKNLQEENKRLKNGVPKSMVDTPKPKADTPKKKKAKKSSKSKPDSTNTLDLPAPNRDRPSVTVPLSAIAYASIPDNIIEAGISMIRATDEEDWPDRAEDWVKLAESRPRFDYK